ncbi:hypothetical protein [Streptomyces sp. NPDC051994]|uniref:hypothetical protein n=1 Tax=unclassified Streptomyces TaxID=2593676 RepID=UPI003417860F
MAMKDYSDEFRADAVALYESTVNLIRLDAWWTNTSLARTRTSRLSVVELAA